MFERSDFLRRVSRSIDDVLLRGESRRAATFLRGPGPASGSAGPSSADWVLVVTDERVLLFAIGAGSGMPVMVESHPLPAVQLVDATMQGTTPSVVLRFPDAVVGWFQPVPAWRSETEAVLGALSGAETGPRPPHGPAAESGRTDGPYPADPSREQIRRSR